MIHAGFEFGRRAWESWCRFFFSPVSPLPLGVFRFLIGLNALIMYSLRALDWRFYFTDLGFTPAVVASELLPEFFRPVLAWYPTTPQAVMVMQVAFLLALLLLCLGLFGRIAAAVAFALHLAFLQRNFSIVYGADIVTTFFLFYLAFADNDREFSLRRYLGLVRRPMSELSQMLSTMGLRLLQLQMCLIYGYTGLEKLKGQSWWDGSAVWAVVGNVQIMMFDLSWLKNFPLAIAAATFSTLLFEVYFPVLVWIRPVRKWLLAFGCLLHAGIGLSVGLVFFSTAMVSTYVVFLEPEWLKEKARRLGVPARAFE